MTIPTIHPIQNILFNLPTTIKLQNNINTYIFDGAKNEIIRIDLVFDCGRWTEKQPLIAETVAKLLKSGTNNETSKQLAEKIDFLGTTIKASSGYNSFTISLYCLNKFLAPSLEILVTLLNDIIFPENELKIFQDNGISKLKISQEKNDYLADVAFKSMVYGKTHPYSYETTETLINNITTHNLIDFYTTEIVHNNCTIFVAGNVKEKQIQLIDKYIGSWKKENKKLIKNITHTKQPSLEKKYHFKKEKSVQASIIIGKELFNKKEEDYTAFLLLNTIFGGYFGSRLMDNIREDKGLTYGIFSGLQTLKYNGVFSIQTDTNLENVDLCINEIYLELDRLQNELITEREITLARNYILGKFLSKTDGCFNQIDLFKSYFIEEIEIEKFEIITQQLRTITATELQVIAQKYLNKNDMYEVIVG